jgi:hypothetical protein
VCICPIYVASDLSPRSLPSPDSSIDVIADIDSEVEAIIAARASSVSRPAESVGVAIVQALAVDEFVASDLESSRDMFAVAAYAGTSQLLSMVDGDTLGRKDRILSRGDWLVW